MKQISNINGNVFHVTVNNYLTLKEEEQMLANKNLENAKRENAQLIKPSMPS